MAQHNVCRKGMVSMAQYDELLVGLCKDLIEMNESTAIDLQQWDNAREFVLRYIDYAIEELEVALNG